MVAGNHLIFSKGAGRSFLWKLRPASFSFPEQRRMEKRLNEAVYPAGNHNGRRRRGILWLILIYLP
jgi:hypothetical protein